jgi:hypothetical protein
MDQGPFDLEDESPGSNSHLPLMVVGNKTDRAPAERAHVSYAHMQAHTVSLEARLVFLVNAGGCLAHCRVFRGQSATDAHFERARFMEFFTQVSRCHDCAACFFRRLLIAKCSLLQGQVVQRKRQRLFRASHARAHVLTSPAVIEFHRDVPTRGVRHRNDPNY